LLRNLTCLPTQAFGFGTGLRTFLLKTIINRFLNTHLLRCPEVRSIAAHFPTAAPIGFRFICHRQRSNKLPS